MNLPGLATGVSWLCYYRALQLGPGSGCAIDKLSVVITLVFTFIFCTEQFTLKSPVSLSLSEHYSWSYSVKNFTSESKDIESLEDCIYVDAIKGDTDSKSSIYILKYIRSEK